MNLLHKVYPKVGSIDLTVLISTTWGTESETTQPRKNLVISKCLKSRKMVGEVKKPGHEQRKGQMLKKTNRLGFIKPMG